MYFYSLIYAPLPCMPWSVESLNYVYIHFLHLHSRGNSPLQYQTNQEFKTSSLSSLFIIFLRGVRENVVFLSIFDLIE
jgi:hypothetical protein